MSKILKDNPLDRYEPTIGLEVHCQLKTKTKLFCSCSTVFGALPNYNTCPICLGYPGVLPVLNEEAINLGLRLALALEATIYEKSIFARKQYFYPDLPKGYQISQYNKPFCENGKLKLSSDQIIRIHRAHFEEDAGKNVHADRSSYVDLNRAGMPLLEIVSEPDIKSPHDAQDYLKKLRALVRHLDICDGNLEEGSIRCDVNVSIAPKGSKVLGTRCEIKNLNSFRNVEKAISYEMIRQAYLLDHGQKVIQSTLQYDSAQGKTVVMRLKEDSQDYRYFPDPDLRPLVLTQERIDLVRKNLPELPEQMAARFEKTFELSNYDAKVLTSDKDLAHYFEKTYDLVKDKVSAKITANWILSELLREVNAREWDISKCPITESMLAELLSLLGEQKISGRIAKDVFEKMVLSFESPRSIVEREGLLQISDSSEIEKVAKEVISKNGSQVEAFKAGKDKLFGFFVGEVMKLGKGKFNPGLVNETLKKLLKEG